MVLPGPAGDGVEGPQHRVWAVPGRSRPIHADFHGQWYLKICSIPCIKGTCLFFSMIKIFQQTYEDDKTAGHEYSVLTHAETVYIAIWVLFTRFPSDKNSNQRPRLEQANVYRKCFVHRSVQVNFIVLKSILSLRKNSNILKMRTATNTLTIGIDKSPYRHKTWSCIKFGLIHNFFRFDILLLNSAF